MSYGRGSARQRKWERLKITGGQGLHNKLIGYSACGAFASGPDDKEEEERNNLLLSTM